MIDQATPKGHPRHQLRPFTVNVRHGSDRARPVHVIAQTEHDAILRAGHALARLWPGKDPAGWAVTSVRDPAPFTWIPGEGNTT